MHMSYTINHTNNEETNVISMHCMLCHLTEIECKQSKWTRPMHLYWSPAQGGGTSPIYQHVWTVIIIPKQDSPA